MFVGRELVVKGNENSSAEEDGVRGDQPLGLVGHDDRRAVAFAKIRILQRTSQRSREFLKIGIGKTGLFAIAIGFNQTSFVGPVVKRIAQSRSQRRILAQIKHEMSISPRRALSP